MTHRVGRSALVGLAYLAVSFLYFGWRIVAHPGRLLIGYGRDPEIFVWSFAWWEHALATWQNPFYSHAIYAPVGINLAWATTVPGLALLFAPVTALFGPGVAYNLAAVLAPAAASFTAFLLCRRVTRSTFAALVGGYLFGFSSYMLGQQGGHLHMTAVFLVPLIALVTLRYLRSELDGRGVGWRLGVLFGLQVWLSTELVVTAALALAVALALAYPLLPATRRRIRLLWRPLLGAAGLAAVIAGPLLYYLVTGFQSQSINTPSVFNGDLVNFVVPTRFVWAGGRQLLSTSEHFAGDAAEEGAYLGLPTLVIIAWYALGARRSATVRYLLALLAIAVLLTLGTGLVINGRFEFSLPWREVARLPVFDNVLPSRFALFGSLAAAVIVALWVAARRGLLRWLLAVLAVAALVPDLAQPDFVLHPERWPFFTTGLYKVCIPKNENVAIFPFGLRDASTLWQAETGFWFRIPEGYLAPTPPAADLAGDPLVQMETYTFDNPTNSQIIDFVHRKKVDRIVSVIIFQPPTGEDMHSFGPLQGVDGVWISPACGYPSMQTGIHPTPPHPVRR